MTTALFWLAAITMAVGQIVLVRAAWRLRTPQIATDPNLPRSDSRADLGWTVITAVLTMLLFVAAYPLATGA
jgi:hypothetical protein